MRLTFLMLLSILFLHIANASVNICNIPLTNTYFAALKKEIISSHRDAKCTEYCKSKTEKKLLKGLKTLKPCQDADCQFMWGDYRVLVEINNNRKKSIIYIAASGHIFYNNNMYEPNNDFLRMVSNFTKDQWKL